MELTSTTRRRLYRKQDIMEKDKSAQTDWKLKLILCFYVDAPGHKIFKPCTIE